MALDWIDLEPCSQRRPVAWSSRGVLFTSHDVLAHVVGFVFPGRTPFLLPVQRTIGLYRNAFGPPTLLATLATDSEEHEYLFAFFPPRPGPASCPPEAAGGIGVIYISGASLAVDQWEPLQHITFSANCSAVACRWFGERREWTCSPDGKLSRNPPLGPPTPVGVTLAIVTQAHQVSLYFRYTFGTPASGFQPAFKVLQTSLRMINEANSNEKPKQSAYGDDGAGVRVCRSAAIGLAYADNSFIVATHSSLLPSYPPASGQLTSAPTSLEYPNPFDNEIYGDEANIELCEVRLLPQRPAVMVLQAFPLAPIANIVRSESLTSMVFVPAPPKTDLKMHLALSFLDFGDFNLEPVKSRVELVALAVNPQGNRFGYYKGLSPPTTGETTSMKTPLWTQKRVATRLCPNDESPNIMISIGETGQHELFASFVDPGATIAKNKHGFVVGETRILTIPDLEFAMERKPAPLFGVVQQGQLTMPMNVTISPNNVLLASAPPVSVASRPPPLHTFPLPEDALPGKLACAIMGRVPFTDIVHVMRSLPLPAVHELLLSTSRILPPLLVTDIVRIAVEVNKRAGREEWTAGTDLCQLLATAVLFEECTEDGAWDLDAVWPLIARTQWVVNLAERIVRECVYLEGEILLTSAHLSQQQQVHVKPDPDAQTDALPTPPMPTDPHPLLCFLLHPLPVHTLLDVLKHIESFRDFITASKTQSSNAYVARQSLLGIVELSPVNLAELKTALESMLSEVEALDESERWRALCTLHAPPGLLAQVATISSRLTSPNLVDKPRLFFDPSASAALRAQQELSVLSKTAEFKKTRQCTICGGLAEEPIAPKPGEAFNRFMLWMRRWNLMCICGGRWLHL